MGECFVYLHDGLHYLYYNHPFIESYIFIYVESSNQSDPLEAQCHEKWACLLMDATYGLVSLFFIARLGQWYVLLLVFRVTSLVDAVLFGVVLRRL